MSGTLYPDYLSASGGLDRIYDGIEAVLPGVQHAMVQLVVWDAIEEFCTRSTLWRLTVGWALAPGAVSLNLNPLDDVAQAVWVLELCGLRRHRLRPPAIIVDLGDTRQARSGTARVACKPRRLAEEVVPAFLVDEWSEVLRDGALYRLYCQPFKPYTSPQLAQMHGRKWRAGVALARVMAKEQNNCPPHFPYFAWGRQPPGGPGGCCPPGPIQRGVGAVVDPTDPYDPYTPDDPSALPVLWIGPGILTAAPGTLPLVSLGPGIVIADMPVVTAPIVSFGSAGVSYPDTTVGTTADSIITLTNTGTAPLIITGITATGDFYITGMELA